MSKYEVFNKNPTVVLLDGLSIPLLIKNSIPSAFADTASAITKISLGLFRVTDVNYLLQNT